MSKRKRKPAVIGRPTLLTPELQKRIVGYIRSGMYEHVAAGACGIGYGTFKEWLARGQGSDDERPETALYASFAAAIQVARLEARGSAEVEIRKIDPKWWLSRMHRGKPDDPGWDDTQKLELLGKDGGTLIPIEAINRLLKGEE